MFTLLATVFGEKPAPLGDPYIGALLQRDAFWAVAAFIGTEVVAGLTAHELPLTTSEATELFIYDVAVQVGRQRTGIGRALMQHLAQEAGRAGISSILVAADDEDAHAISFYNAVGAEDSPVHFFVLPASARDGRRDSA